jgi:carbamoylphosphate synthase large subunit
MVCAEINQDGRFLGIDPFETAEIINNKEKFRAFAAQHNLPTPRVLSEQEVGTRWPVIVKPVDAFSGRGVTVIREDNKQELPTALDVARQASRTSTCIVEDYVEGQLYSHTAFLQNGEIISDHIVEEHGTANPFVVDTSRVTYDFPAAMLESVRRDITLLASKLSLQDGLVHTQFIKAGSQYWLIEITRRCPGDLYSQLIELSTGFNYAENYARPFVGLSCNILKNNFKRWVMRHTLTQPYDYTLGSLSFSLPLIIKKWVPISLTGDRLRASPYGRISIIFAEMSSEQALNETFTATIKRQLYTVAPQ